MIVLIPAYKPDESLVRLAQQITELDAHAEILVVDDGSGSTYVPIFTELAIRGVTIIAHPANRGKGARPCAPGWCGHGRIGPITLW